MSQHKPPYTDSLLIVHADGAIRGGGGASGLGFIVRDERGHVLHMGRRQAGAMTNNEAEYAAVVFALEELRVWRGRPIRLCSDSKVVIEQLRGEVSVHSPWLQRWYQRAKALQRGFRQITFLHVSREENRLADALANEALLGNFRL